MDVHSTVLLINSFVGSCADLLVELVTIFIAVVGIVVVDDIIG